MIDNTIKKNYNNSRENPCCYYKKNEVFMYKLMIVDDNNVQLSYLTTCIDYTKFNILEIKTAMDGEEGLELYNEFQADIVLTDIEMPKMDGVEMMKKIKNINSNCKFIFISCYDDFSYIKEAMDNDAASYILKPVSTFELEEKLEKILDDIKKEEDFSEFTRIFGESLENFRENFLYRFLHSSHIEKSYLNNMMKNLGYLKYRNFLVAALNFDGETDIYNFLSIAKSTLFCQTDGSAVGENDNRCVVVFMSTEDDSYESVKNTVNDFCEKLFREDNIRVSAGLSKLSDSPYDLKYLLSQAIGALDGKMFSLETGVYECEDGNAINSSEYDIAEFYNYITDIIENINETSIEDFLKKHYDGYTNMHYLKKMSFSVVSALQLVLMERGINTGDLFLSSSAVWDKLERFETILDTRRWLYNILKTATDYVSDSENSRYKKIVNDIIENINENYASVSNVNDIIKDLYISASYAQSLFKKYTGKTISDYVIEKRMESAKSLLEDPYIKVYEVAELVGYKSKAHFSEIFKKYTGVTPKEFRQKH